jgi:hypothetical protein
MVIAMTKPTTEGGIGLVLPDTTMPLRGAAAEASAAEAAAAKAAAAKATAAEKARIEAERMRTPWSAADGGEEGDTHKDEGNEDGDPPNGGEENMGGGLVSAAIQKLTAFQQANCQTPEDEAPGGKKRPLEEVHISAVVKPPAAAVNVNSFQGDTRAPQQRLVQIRQDFSKANMVRRTVAFLDRVQEMFVSATYLTGVTSFHPEAVQLQSMPDEGKDAAKSRATANKSTGVHATFGVFPSHVLRVSVIAEFMLTH